MGSICSLAASICLRPAYVVKVGRNEISIWKVKQRAMVKRYTRAPVACVTVVVGFLFMLREIKS